MWRTGQNGEQAEGLRGNEASVRLEEVPGSGSTGRATEAWRSSNLPNWDPSRDHLILCRLQDNLPTRDRREKTVLQADSAPSVDGTLSRGLSILCGPPSSSGPPGPCQAASLCRHLPPRLWEMKENLASPNRKICELTNASASGAHDRKKRSRETLIFIYLVFSFRSSNVTITRVTVSPGPAGNTLKTTWRFRK